MKKLLILPFLAITLLAESSFYQPTGWILGTEFPGKPKMSEKKTKSPQGEVVEFHASCILKKNGEVYELGRVLYPFSILPEERDALYKAGKGEMLRATRRVFKSEEKIFICGHEGRRYLFETKDGTRLIEHRIVFVANESYHFGYERFAKDAASSASDAFFSKITQKKD